jgi:oxygen-independent coproporphyrinogen III oxidase
MFHVSPHVARAGCHQMSQLLTFDPELLKRYDKSGPRYTSYPTAVQFHTGFGPDEYRMHVERTHRESRLRPLSLYFHIPFCDTVCFYCGCNRVVTKNRKRASSYLARLHREIELQGALFSRERTVDQLHWGGGTPTFISHDEMRELMEITRRNFRLRDDDQGEYGIEVDPREANEETVALLRALGFNRISLGVQDFDPQVQQAVNRIQSEAETFAVLNAAHRHGFRSVNIDLIYGLPHQTAESFGRTLGKIIDAGVDRLSVFNYAHLPQLFKSQRQINDAALPPPQVKLAILQMTIERLTAAGYVYIGMDHFARPGDELAVAQRSGSLYRNFQGYSTHADCDLVGLGSTAISQVGDCYGQNTRTLEEYYDRLDASQLAVFRGVELNPDDRLRRDVITGLICHFTLDIARIEARHGIRFRDYFQGELADLAAMQQDGLLTVRPDRIDVEPRGKLLIRNICMVFDRYLRQQQAQRFSKVI